jgi:hypothetical protein
MNHGRACSPLHLMLSCSRSLRRNRSKGVEENLVLGSVGMGIVWGWLMVWLAWPRRSQTIAWRTAVWLIVYTTAFALPLTFLYTLDSALIFLASTAVGIIAHAIARQIILEL